MPWPGSEPTRREAFLGDMDDTMGIYRLYTLYSTVNENNIYDIYKGYHRLIFANYDHFEGLVPTDEL